MKITTKVELTIQITTETRFSGAHTLSEVARESKLSALFRVNNFLMDKGTEGIRILGQPKVVAVTSEIDE